MTKRDEALARLRAELIVEVRSGRMSAREAAQRLGVSRKTYYKWEKRALAGMVEALGNRAGGRPPPRIDAEKEALREKKEELERRLKVVEETLNLHRRLFPLHPLKAAKPSGAGKKE
ncbi:MAG: helix-turn-helix domain-containing protein [Candidatus Binatia bacterium]